MRTARPPRPDLDPGDRVLIMARRWVTSGDVHAWLPTGDYRWRVVDRVVWDTYCGWQIVSTPTAPHHPSRESANAVAAVLRAGGERRPAGPAAVRPATPVQLSLWDAAS